jgi:3-hydroxyisobutyrate dehydrogenase-like beta-hydroxyacid dehydrogenase
VSAAVSASPLVLLCVTNYPAAQALIGESSAQLAGKVLVNFTTCLPQEARAAEALVRQHGAGYLQGAITGSPASIGRPDGHILLSGDEAVLRSAEPVLRVLAGKLDYKGPAIGLAPAWDIVMIMHYFGMFLSLFHSVQVCQAEGIPLEQFSALLGEQHHGYEQWLVENIRTASYSETSAPLELWAGPIQRIAQHARESGLDAGFVTLAAELFQKAMAAGYGREEVSALYKVLGGE